MVPNTCGADKRFVSVLLLDSALLRALLTLVCHGAVWRDRAWVWSVHLGICETRGARQGPWIFLHLNFLQMYKAPRFGHVTQSGRSESMLTHLVLGGELPCSAQCSWLCLAFFKAGFSSRIMHDARLALGEYNIR